MSRQTDWEGALAGLPASTPLFGPELNLDSFSGMTLLSGIQRDYGFDLAAEDLALESLATIGTLAAYLAVCMLALFVTRWDFPAPRRPNHES